MPKNLKIRAAQFKLFSCGIWCLSSSAKQQLDQNAAGKTFQVQVREKSDPELAQPTKAKGRVTDERGTILIYIGRTTSYHSETIVCWRDPGVLDLAAKDIVYE